MLFGGILVDQAVHLPERILCTPEFERARRIGTIGGYQFLCAIEHPSRFVALTQRREQRRDVADGVQLAFAATSCAREVVQTLIP
jgi:hypothetical protein